MELVVAIGVGSVILLGAGEAIFQILNGVDRGVDQLSGLRDVENASLWLTRDIRMAEYSDLSDGAPPVNSHTLQWTDSQSGGTHVVSYAFSGSTLTRNFDGVITTVARHLESVSFSRSGRLLELQIMVFPESAGSFPEKTYSVLMRPE